MYLLILYLPFLSFLNGTLLGRYLGRKGSPIYSCILMGITFFLSLYILYEVSFCNSPVYIHLNDWISVDILNVKALFFFDSLTSLMLLVVTSISFLVHVYSVSYMSEDPHLQRFISLLSLFTFFMIVLVTGSNLLQIFVGWEGKLHCLKWANQFLNTAVNYPPCALAPDWDTWSSISLCARPKVSTPWVWNTLNSLKKVGPHNIDIISLIIGSTLGDSHLEKRKSGKGTRVIFEQCGRNVEYLMYFFKILKMGGYCNPDSPVLKKRIGRNNNVLFYYRINSYTFYSFNWLYDLFYEQKNEKWVKTINPVLIRYINPMVLAVWFMDDGSKSKSSYRIATCNFSKKDCEILSNIINQKFGLSSTVQICRTINSNKKYYQIYIPKKDVALFNSIVDPFMVQSMRYKLV